LDADPPAKKIAWQRRKLPAGNFDPGRNGWLCQVPFGLDTWDLSELLLRQLGCQPHDYVNLWIICFGAMKETK